MLIKSIYTFEETESQESLSDFSVATKLREGAKLLQNTGLSISKTLTLPTSSPYAPFFSSVRTMKPAYSIFIFRRSLTFMVSLDNHKPLDDRSSNNIFSVIHVWKQQRRNLPKVTTLENVRLGIEFSLLSLI